MGTRLLSGYGSNLGPISIANCTSSIISSQFWRGDHLYPHPFLYWLWLFGHPGNQKYHYQRTYNTFFGSWKPAIVSRIQHGRASTVVDTIDRIWKNMGMDQIWVGMGQIWAPMQLQNCTFWIVNCQFWVVIILPIPIPLLGLTIWASSEPKIPLPKDLYFWEPTATVQILGWGYFIYLEDFGGLKFACQNLIHQHNNIFVVIPKAQTTKSNAKWPLLWSF